MYQKEVFSKNLKKYVRKSGKTAKQICRDLNIPYQKYKEWISPNSVHMPHTNTIVALANYFGVQYADLLADDATNPIQDKQTQNILKQIEQMEKQAMRTKKPHTTNRII